MPPWENSKRTRQIVDQRERIVRSVSQQSLTRLLKDYREKDFESAAPRLWSEARSIRLTSQTLTFARMRWKVGYFGRRWSETLQDHEIRTEVLLERDAYSSVAARLKQSSDDLKRSDTGSRTIGAGKGWTMALRAKARCTCCVICAPIAAGISTNEGLQSVSSNENSPGHRR